VLFCADDHAELGCTRGANDRPRPANAVGVALAAALHAVSERCRQHSCIESPDRLTVYQGQEATVIQKKKGVLVSGHGQRRWCFASAPGARMYWVTWPHAWRPMARNIREMEKASGVRR